MKNLNMRALFDIVLTSLLFSAAIAALGTLLILREMPAGDLLPVVWQAMAVVGGLIYPARVRELGGEPTRGSIMLAGSIAGAVYGLTGTLMAGGITLVTLFNQPAGSGIILMFLVALIVIGGLASILFSIAASVIGGLVNDAVLRRREAKQAAAPSE